MASAKDKETAKKGGELIGGFLGLALIILILWAVVASQCSSSDAPNPKWPIKKYAAAVAGDGAKVETFEQINQTGKDNGKYFVQITIPGPGTFMGGPEDWNMFAGRVASISQPLLKRSDVVRVRMISHAQNIDWAYADLKKSELPKDFDKLLYLQVASFAHLDAGTDQASRWLCKFYDKYDSARPNGMMPQWCSRY